MPAHLGTHLFSFQLLCVRLKEASHKMIKDVFVVLPNLHPSNGASMPFCESSENESFEDVWQRNAVPHSYNIFKRHSV